jgi:hypothetical protein
MNEFELLKEEPLKLFNYYLEQLSQGIELDDPQVVKFEYLKKTLLKE